MTKSKILSLLLTLGFLGPHTVKAQIEVKVFTEPRDGGGYIIYASNDNYCPVSMMLTLELKNMVEAPGQPEIHVVPARTEKFKLTELTVKDPKKGYTYSSKFRYNMGNAAQTEFDKDYAWELPFAQGTKFVVAQGYNGSLSHHNQKSLDFTMPEGTEVIAARGGVVVKVVEENSKGCPQEDCKQYNNYVIIYHSDGTFAEYVHVRKNGVKVKEGDTVKAGDLIAYSGNVGWSSGPHLHFSCYLQGIEQPTTLPTKFKVGDGKQVVMLEEKTSYAREY